MSRDGSEWSGFQLTVPKLKQSIQNGQMQQTFQQHHEQWTRNQKSQPVPSAQKRASPCRHWLRRQREFFSSFFYSTESRSAVMERFSIKYRKTKTKVITLANHRLKGHRQFIEPIKTRQIYEAGVKRGKRRVGES